LITGAIIGYVVALTINYSEAIFGAVPVGAVLLNMAVFGAVISYALQMLSFIPLRKNLPDIERPYRSPVGVPGAWIALAIAVVALLFLLPQSGLPRRRLGVCRLVRPRPDLFRGIRPQGTRQRAARRLTRRSFLVVA
jgi:amino acid transporter